MARLYADSFGRLSDPIQPETMRFIFDEPYQWGDLPPQEIREDFAGLCFEHGQDPQVVLDSLAAYLPADTLAQYLDDLAMGRV